VFGPGGLQVACFPLLPPIRPSACVQFRRAVVRHIPGTSFAVQVDGSPVGSLGSAICTVKVRVDCFNRKSKAEDHVECMWSGFQHSATAIKLTVYT